MKNRIKAYRQVKASDLRRNPANWRIHPETQETEMRKLLDKIGYADALMCAETPDGLLLLDGHLRADLSGDEKVPVLITDLSPDEQKVVLATQDTIGRLAEWDEVRMEELLAEVEALPDVDLAALASIGRGPLQDMTLQTDGEGRTNVEPENVPLTARITVRCPVAQQDDIRQKIGTALQGMDGVEID